MIEQLSNAIKFRAFYVASKTGKTGLTVTVDVYNPADTKIVTAGAATEIGGGLYGYTLASGSVTTEGEYVCIFKTSDATVDAQHMAAVWVVGRAGVETLDAAISSRNATTPPTAGAIADALWDEHLVDHAAAGSTGAHLEIAGAGGDPWAVPVPGTYAAGTAGALFGKLDVGADDLPVTVVPAPPADASMCTVYCYTESLIGLKRQGITITFKLSGKPGKSDRVLETAPVTATSDANGLISINLQRTDQLTPAGMHYIVKSKELGLDDVAMTLAAATFDLGGLIA